MILNQLIQILYGWTFNIIFQIRVKAKLSVSTFLIKLSYPLPQPSAQSQKFDLFTAYFINVFHNHNKCLWILLCRSKTHCRSMRSALLIWTFNKTLLTLYCLVQLIALVWCDKFHMTQLVFMVFFNGLTQGIYETITFTVT